MSYSAKVKDIRDKIVTKLKTVSEFDNRVYSQFHVKETNFPMALVQFDSDEISSVSPNTSQHSLTFIAVVHYRGMGDEESYDRFIDLVGKSYDALISDRTLSNTVTSLEIPRIDFTFEAEESLIFHLASFEVVVIFTRQE